MLRAFSIVAVLLLWLAPSSQAAAFLAAPSASAPITTAPENASTAFFEEGSETRIGLLCHNDPVNKSDPFGLYAPEIDDKKTQEQFNQLKEKSQAFRDQFKKWEGDKEKRSIKSANDSGNFKGRNQSPTKNGPGNSTEPQGILGKIASWLRGGQGRGGTIYYNPNNRATAQGRDREPIFGLAHELGHLIDIGNGNYPSSVVPSAAETRAGENTAIGWEREAQQSLGETNLRPYQ